MNDDSHGDEKQNNEFDLLQSKGGNGAGSNEALSTDGGSITTNPAFRGAHQASFRSTVSDSEVEQGNVRRHEQSQRESIFCIPTDSHDF